MIRRAEKGLVCLHRKRWACILLAALLAVLSGCGKEGEPEQPPEAPALTALPASEEYVQAAENARFLLSVRPNSGEFRLLDKESGSVWDSTPSEAAEDEALKGIAKTNLRSALVMTVSGDADSEEPLNSYAGCVIKNGVRVGKIENGFRVCFSFAAEDIQLFADVVLTADGLTVEIPRGGIRENGVFKIFTLSLYPYFGAASAADEGYAVLPDGMGALVRFNNGKGSFPVYKQALYGGDLSFAASQQSTVTEQAYLPVFGVRNNGAAFAAVCEAGAEYGYVNAFVAGQAGNYNGAYFSFGLRSVYRYSIDGVNDIQLYDKKDILCAGIRLRYLFTSQQEADYCGLAALLRKYGEETLSLQAKEVSLSAGLSVPAQTTVSENLFGFSAEKDVNLTTYSQLTEMIAALRDGGMDALYVTYAAAVKSEQQGRIASAVQPVSSLGGAKEFARLYGLDGAVVAPEVSFLSFRKSGNGVNYFTDTVRNLSNAQAKLQIFKPSTFYPDKEKPVRYMLTPAALLERKAAVAEKTKEAYRDAIAVKELARSVYGDYNKNGRAGREACVTAVKETLAALRQSFAEVGASGANFYALPYLTRVTDLPLTSSGYLLTDETIPFLPLVYGGYADLYSTPVNLTADPAAALLRCLENGVMPAFALFSECGEQIPETNGQAYFGCRFSSAESKVLALWETFSQARAVLQGRLLSHQQLEDGVVLSRYEQGGAVINYTSQAVDTPYGKVGAGEFLLLDD